ncbi:hypothetical protein BC01_107 [Bacillus phage BC01]|nr:hypothetical protein BC01_107 [Bacillus phage BC01]
MTIAVTTPTATATPATINPYLNIMAGVIADDVTVAVAANAFGAVFSVIPRTDIVTFSNFFIFFTFFTRFPSTSCITSSIRLFTIKTDSSSVLIVVVFSNGVYSTQESNLRALIFTVIIFTSSFIVTCLFSVLRAIHHTLHTFSMIRLLLLTVAKIVLIRV